MIDNFQYVAWKAGVLELKDCWVTTVQDMIAIIFSVNYTTNEYYELRFYYTKPSKSPYGPIQLFHFINGKGTSIWDLGYSSDWNVSS